MPRLRGFSPRNLRNIRTFNEEWRALEANSSVATGELQIANGGEEEIHQLRLTNYEDSPVIAFMSIGFSHHYYPYARLPRYIDMYYLLYETTKLSLKMW